MKTQIKSISIACSEAAKVHFKKVLKKAGATGVHVFLKKAGCAGYMYGTELLMCPPEGAQVVQIDPQLSFYVLQKWCGAFDGVVIDLHTHGVMETKLRFENPNTIQSCGCGDSVLLK